MAYLEHTQGKTSCERPASTLIIQGTIRNFPACMGPGKGADNELEGELLVAKPKTKPKRPPFYKVILLNDDYTPMDFVVLVLENIFHKAHEEANALMIAIHEKGQAVVECTTRDIAETKTDQVIQYARMNDYPLQCVMEKE